MDTFTDGRCIVIAPRHEFIRPWIRAYFATGNTIPLVIATGPDGDWQEGDMEYCEAAAKFSGGLVFDCSEEWRSSSRLADRAVLETRIGWYSKKYILHAVATRLAPKSWAWIDDDVEITGNLDECFDYAENAPGFILTQFYVPGEVGNRHPDGFYRSDIDTDDKMSWNSFMFFHGEANQRIAESLGADFPVEDDEIIFCRLYKENPAWRNGFCDFSIRSWQFICKTVAQIPSGWMGKALHYTSCYNNMEVKRMWAEKAASLPPAPFELKEGEPMGMNEDEGPIDAVFVIGTGSVNGNEELRYALRNLDRNCRFVRDVYICGECPSWVDKSVVKHLQWPDRFHHAKDANIIDKLRHACECKGIAKRILFCSDDQFQTRECSWGDFRPRYLRVYTSSDPWYDAKRRIWHTRLRKTLEREVERRRASGLDTSRVYYYQPHIWMPIDRDRFIEYAKWCGYDHRDDTIIAAGYFNFVDADGCPDFEHAFIGRNSDRIPEALHIAYHDGSYDVAMKILKSLFPSRCRFELETKSERVVAKEPASAPADDRDGLSAPWKAPDDPSRATADEAAKIREVTGMARSDVALNWLLGDISRAEELRLFGVKGWRTVWRDIVSRCERGGKARMSGPALAVLNAYMANPNSMRTIKFGISATAPAPASDDTRRHLREKVGAALRRRQ